MELSYHPAAPGARLELWGVFYGALSADLGHLRRGGQSVAWHNLTPVPFRSAALPFMQTRELDYLDGMADRPGKVPALRVGVSDGFGRRTISLTLMVGGVILLLVHLGALAAVWCRRNPLVAASLAVLLAVGLWERLYALGAVHRAFLWPGTVEQVRQMIALHLPRPGQFLNGSGIYYDAAQYMAEAIRIYANQQRMVFEVPYGLSLASSVIFEFTGIDPQAVRIFHSLVSVATGLVLYAAATRLTDQRWLSLLPVAFWIVLDAQIKYTFLYLTETLAAFLLLCALTVLLTIVRRRGGERSKIEMTAALLVCGALLAQASYVRDIVVLLLPAVALMLVVVQGVSRRILGAAAILVAAVAVWWLPLPALFLDKDLSPFGFLPLSTERFHQAATVVVGDQSNGLLGQILAQLSAQVPDGPWGWGMFLVRSFQGFWWPTWGGDIEAAFRQASPLVWRVYGLLTPLFPLPDGAIIHFHPCDLHFNEIAGNLRGWKRYAHLHNADRAPDLLLSMIDMLANKGYRFVHMRDLAGAMTGRPGLTRHAVSDLRPVRPPQPTAAETA